MVSSTASTDEVDAAFAAGASAYVLKTAHPDDFVTAVRQTFEHSIYTAPHAARWRRLPTPSRTAAS